ncbi:hypothetical protein scyTo_0021084 [Scyliorhinus torazame]|uniref:Secreted protein n=1 Tax=Scyliorhinus torazame TaxID=75743 RepID=A0A401PVX9_SCYTO|nr:hypothetical protein [Scyliorhinus torazame]
MPETVVSMLEFAALIVWFGAAGEESGAGGPVPEEQVALSQLGSVSGIWRQCVKSSKMWMRPCAILRSVSTHCAGIP